jgi:FAD-dependent sensor of blue light
MNKQVFRTIYCSRNRIRGSAKEITTEILHILESARANNAALSVTGALLYTSENFAQVLEGPVEAVGKTFEKIQQDLRHSEVIVVESGFTGERHFADWSMAFSSADSMASTERAADAFHNAFAGKEGAGEEILAVLRELVQREDHLALIDTL